MPENSNIDVKKPSWVKQLYYYLILAFCILFLSIGSFILLRANLVRYVFTELDQDSSSYYVSQCAYPTTTKTDGTTDEPDRNSSEYKECVEKGRLKQYQSDMLTSILQILIAAVVLTIHLKFIKLKE